MTMPKRDVAHWTEGLRVNVEALFIVAFCILFFVEVLTTHKAVKEWYDLGKATDLMETLSWIKQNSKPDDFILTTWVLGYPVVTYTNRKVIATSKVYPSEIKAVAERYRDISKFFLSESEED